MIVSFYPLINNTFCLANIIRAALIPAKKNMSQNSCLIPVKEHSLALLPPTELSKSVNFSSLLSGTLPAGIVDIVCLHLLSVHILN